MRIIPTMAILAGVAAPAAAQDLADLLPGIYANTEQVYFQGEAGEPQDRWISLRFTADGDGAFTLQPVDAFGEPVEPAETVTVVPRGDLTALSSNDCTRLFRPEGDAFVLDASEGMCDDLPAVMQRIGPAEIAMAWPDGRPLELRRARPVSCWISVRKTESDGESEWTFDSGLMMHDQGGRIRAGGGDSGAPVAIVRMRNVIWPAPSRNRPSLVLYVHTEDDPDRAVSYSWADPGAERIGINLRWMQASCTVQDGNGDE
ncbi:hypothetical protein HFP57_14375 [Parasphingopyxis algicola]|uniref:hypothetical protein n=1 Tax=Parasphingopyxis algicola TaxID=2026624 RepID=UPI0015A19392|nr:hypothetical protein [Parasphingopyxis algicola]QLC26090.1 hypothetical protein HFP57_14375 [Parasphingopyxis algicola]